VNLSRLAVLASAVGLGACTGEASFMLPSVDAGAPSARYGAVCGAWARRACAYAGSCGNPLVGWEDNGQCVERETLSCELQADDPDVPFDPALVAGCTFPASCLYSAGVTGPPYALPLCLPPGKAPTGAPCVWNSGCQSGECDYAYVPGGTKASCGTCEPALKCACAITQECVFADGGDVACVTLPDAGEACGAPLFACNDAECVTSADAADGMCMTVPAAGIGSPCTTGPAGPTCFSTASALYCDSTEHCSAYAPAAYGDPCALSTGGEGNVCVGAGWCDSTGTGICQPPSPDGAPCEGTTLPCLPPARCLSGACTFPSLASCSR